MRDKIAANDTTPLEESWHDLKRRHVRPGTLPKWAPPPVKQVHTWVNRLSEGGSALLTVTGPNPTFRAEVFQVCYAVPGLRVLGGSRNHQDWVHKGVLHDITQRVRGLTGRPWGVVWELLEVRDFIVEEPLRGLIDQGFGFTGFFKALWEGRFLLQEGRKQESLALLAAVLRWLCALDLSDEHQAALTKVHITRELASLQERLDMLLFLLALIYQNGLADRTVLVLDGLDQAARTGPDKRKELFRQLTETTNTFERWSRLGSATGLVFGVSTEGLEAISHYNERLCRKIEAAVV